MPKFYYYRQNNSGGVFWGQKYVFIRAESFMQANEIAQANDIYFYGCRTGRDCSCCGNRWEPVNEWSFVYSPEDVLNEVRRSGRENVRIIV